MTKSGGGEQERYYLSVAEIVALHRAVMEATGYHHAPLRDEGALESAAMRPRMAAYYEEAGLIRQSVLLAVGIAPAQAFLDGNKRTAFAAMDAFLRVNGLHFSGDPLELAQQLEAIAARPGSLSEAADQFGAWLRARVAPL